MNGNPRKPKVLTVARDAGAANALARVVRTLNNDGLVTTTVIGYRYAEAVFRQFELPLWAAHDDGTTTDVAEQVLHAENPDFVLTGTSMRPQRDGAFWSAARARGIPTLAVVDHWAHYWERFSDPGGPRFAYLPDTIAVMDEISRRAMIEEGCPPDRLVVTSQPAFDDFDSLTDEAERDLRALARRELGCGEDDVLLVFASEPIAKYFGADESSPKYLGYTEANALQVVLDAARLLPAEDVRRLHLIVKLHPAETHEVLHAVVARASGLRVRILQHFPPRKLIAASDVVTGMTSIFLLEAALFGRPSISIEPGGTSPDTYIRYQGGLIQQATELEAVRQLLTASMRETHAERQQRKQLAIAHGFDGRASRRIAALIYQKLVISTGLDFEEPASLISVVSGGN